MNNMQTAKEIRREIHKIYQRQPDPFKVTRKADITRIDKMMEELREDTCH